MVQNTLPWIVEDAAQSFGDSVAILGVDGTSLIFKDLFAGVQRSGHLLRELGIGRTDRIAIVLPNGPEMCTCFLSVTSVAACAPLNPAYSAAEFEFYLQDLKPAAIIVAAGSDSAAIGVANRLEIPVLRLAPASGWFELEGPQIGRCGDGGPAQPDDLALLLHTSGSTSRPKLVPLSHGNLCHSAESIRTALQLTARDRCLNVMPLFHVHGLVGGVLSSLKAGASIVCTPGFHAPSFVGWLEQFQATWYTAVPTMHQSILNRVDGGRVSSSLRMIRSCSSALPPSVMTSLEAAFGVPVVEAYGMTEASHQMAINPLPPLARKPGSVGLATGCEIGVVDDRGSVVPAHEPGNVVIRGTGVTRGYVDNPEANESAFSGGWFHTGDQGYLDADGYLFLTGRTKEIINRGGEKISPREIDEVLLTHPGVAQAMAFALPDSRLGEDVGVLVVPREPPGDSGETARVLRQYVAQRLADFKVPRRIFFVDELPKGPTGKPQRIGAAQRLGLTEAPPANEPRSAAFADVAPRDSGTMILAHIWEDVLSKAPIGIHDDFFELGGDSVLAAGILSRVQDTFGKRLELASFLEAPTVAKMTFLLTETPELGYEFEASKVIPIRASGNLPPLFVMGPHPLFRSLILALPRHLPVFGITFPDHKTLSVPFRLEEVAEQQVAAIRRFRPQGPYALMGWCADGILAYEIARILKAQGEDVSLLAIVDAFNPTRWRQERRWSDHGSRLKFHWENLKTLDFSGAAAYVTDRMRTLERRIRRGLWRAAYQLHMVTDRRISDGLRIPEQILGVAISRYVPGPYGGRTLLVRAAHRPVGTHGDPVVGWRNLIANLHVADVPGNHVEMFAPENAQIMAAAIAAQMEASKSEGVAAGLESVLMRKPAV